MNIHSLRTPATAARCALVAALSLAALPASVVAADAAAADQERRMRELEDRVRQEDARREMESRTRQQQEALRGQQEAIRRLEESRARLEQQAREVAEQARELGRNYSWNYSTFTDSSRALLGVSVDNASGNREGAVVRNVSPGGGAEVAGIRAGDIITALNGESLAKDGDPARALVEKMRSIEPDAKVKVDLLRNGRKMNLEVTARAAPQALALAAPGQRVELLRNLDDRLRAIGPGGAVRVEPGRGDGAQAFSFQLDSGNRFGGMEFATVSDRLGDYFGVDSGVLVVRAGADSPYGLQDGDVILSIDGRTPTDAQHAGRILRSYQPGEKVKLRVQRDRKAIDLDSTAPGRRN
jgi:C-terminal processing protease CtpA/Prc